MSHTQDTRYTSAMPKAVQIRDVPEEAVAVLKARAAVEGQSLSDYLRRQLLELVGRPTREELLARIAAREPVQLDEPPWVTIRRLRDAADA